MKRLLIALILLFATSAFAVEQLDLTTPVTTPSITSYKIIKLILDVEGQEIIVWLRSDSNEATKISYNGDEATTLMVAMNKMNFTTTSMQKKILQKLIADGKLPGTISGLPD